MFSIKIKACMLLCVTRLYSHCSQICTSLLIREAQSDWCGLSCCFSLLLSGEIQGFFFFFFRPWHHWRLVASSFTECYSNWSTWCFSASLFFCKSAVGVCILFSTNLVSILTFRFFLPKIVFISLHWEAYFSSLPVLWWAFFKVCKCPVLPHPLSFSMHYSRMDLMKATTLL